jgi:hypothetical protein
MDEGANRRRRRKNIRLLKDRDSKSTKKVTANKLEFFKVLVVRCVLPGSARRDSRGENMFTSGIPYKKEKQES